MAIETQPKIFCIFHQRTECICIAPVTNDGVLKIRLANAIKINELNNKFESNEDLKLGRIPNARTVALLRIRYPADFFKKPETIDDPTATIA